MTVERSSAGSTSGRVEGAARVASTPGVALTADDFDVFGLEHAFSIDAAELDRRRRSMLAEAHPDRFVTEGASAQRVAMQWSVRINEAYRNLKDPLRRAAALCELNAVPVDAERNTAMPAEFLSEQMAWREALDEAEGAEAIDRLAARVAAYRGEAFDRLATMLDAERDFPKAAAQVRALMFIERLAGDIERRRDALEQ